MGFSDGSPQGKSLLMETLIRIKEALDKVAPVFALYQSGEVKAEQKSGGRGPITEADRMANKILRENLLRQGEGWLSEESTDDLERLQKRRVWIVDPLDGTHEFVAGIPEWCISIGLVENGRAVAGGVYNPATKEVFLGSLESGVTYNGKKVYASRRSSMEGALVLASRSEVRRGEWDHLRNAPFEIRPTGSVAYKLALVSASLADATWTLSPKHEWDVAGGVALVRAAGGFVDSSMGKPVTFNNERTLFPGLLAGGTKLQSEIRGYATELAPSGKRSTAESGTS